MGREAEGHARWRGQDGAVKALLESDGIILRGDIRARLRRDDLMDWRVDGDDLCLRAGGEPLILTLGAKEAAAWVKALDKPLPLALISAMVEFRFAENMHKKTIR